MTSAEFPLQSSFAHQFAEDWANAWNSHDLNSILAHYEDEITLSSPVALRLLGNSVVQGKPALREYFQRGLQAYPDLRFDIINVLWGVDTIVLYYQNNVRGSITAEAKQLSRGGKIRVVWANYDG